MIIDTEKLDSLELHELAMLLFLYNKKVDKSRTVVSVKDVDIYAVLDKLRNKGYISAAIYATDTNYQPPYKHICYSLLEKGKNALADNCMQDKGTIKALSKKAVKDRCDKLAPRLREIYPMGKKPGTSNQWRGYEAGVSEKLQKLLLSGSQFTDEEAIAATKAYVESFNGNYTNMRVLPYFLGKNEIVGGEVKKSCDFMSYVEDIRTNPKGSISPEWETSLR